MSEPHIRLRGVGKRYDTKDGPVDACGDINLDIRQSEFVAIVGPSGCGKTTILKMAAGLVPYTAGEITVANPASKEQAVLNKQADALLGYFMDQGPRMQLQTGVKMGWTRLYDMAGVTTLSSAIISNNDWLKDAKNQDALRRFLRATQRGWQYSFDHRAEAAEIFRKAAPVFTQEIALLEVDGTMSIIRTERTKGKPIAWSDAGDWKDSQELLEKFAKLKPQPDVNVYYTNSYLSEAPYMPKK